MKSSMLVASAVVILVVGGVSVYILTALGGVQKGLGLTQSSTQSQLATNQGSPSNLQYACAKPAIQSQYTCDQLPSGYQIPPRFPNSPQAECSSQMSQSSCALLKQTLANGVCDPNETVWTDPLDCGCNLATIGDPYTGRCGTPATICQLAPVGGPHGGD